MEQSNQHRSGSLFERATDFAFVQIGMDDARRRTDNLALLGSLLSECSPMYPLIKQWYESKVIPGLRSGERLPTLLSKEKTL